MASPALVATMRRATPRDVAAITVLLASALDTDPVVRWLLPNSTQRVTILHRLLAVGVDHAIETGTVDVTVNLSAVAVWRRYDPHASACPLADHQLTILAGTAAGRLRQLTSAVDGYRSWVPHHWLSWLAVHPAYRRQGLASELLRRHHAVVGSSGWPACTVVTTEAVRDLLRRQGYHAALPLALPDGPKLWPLSREARPVRPGASLLPDRRSPSRPPRSESP
ncbi:GNAT family N-acetyltransferase [Micromonospora sp. AMSO12t]|uniref:GNAT family N-acetyltransferase n=1 Tax=unclassified Micromonospora TaxID=2617518 RepID=UPI00124B6BB5|nr:GNAT family N-acetyltransferase [Micromonospora sp. AMSO12t]KAB1161401.1 GNAT family N-acetyltransferase [Micromonospora sp. AMSO12t]